MHLHVKYVKNYVLSVQRTLEALVMEGDVKGPE